MDIEKLVSEIERCAALATKHKGEDAFLRFPHFAGRLQGAADFEGSAHLARVAAAVDSLLGGL
jgi:hypothetical protein